MHARELDVDFPAMLSRLQEIIGPKITAVIADIDDPQCLQSWMTDPDQVDPVIRERLRHAYETTQILLEKEPPQAIRTWFAGSNHYLDDRSPALTLSKDPIGVQRAALAFVATG
jgi:hypothetical protein